MSGNEGKMCLYTVVLGRYEALNELTAEIASAPLAKICFTDDPELTSDTWDIRLVNPAFPMDTVRSQRMLKMLAHRYLPEFEHSLYIDNTISLRRNPAEIINSFCTVSDISVPLHSYRDHVHEEFIEVAKSGLDDPARIFEQMNHYMITHGEVLKSHPYWTAIMVRNHMKTDVIKLMENWYEHILRYSRRDQLSLNYVEKMSNMKINPIRIDNFLSEYHQWPIISKRDISKRMWSVELSGRMSVYEKMEKFKNIEKSLDIKIRQLANEYEEIKEKYTPRTLPEGFISAKYYELNPDVAVAGADAAEHYLTYGWKEDRRWK